MSGYRRYKAYAVTSFSLSNDILVLRSIML
nr:MAG TPA: hypothetical protein [Caudoviricetes sp.]